MFKVKDKEFNQFIQMHINPEAKNVHEEHIFVANSEAEQNGEENLSLTWCDKVLQKYARVHFYL